MTRSDHRPSFAARASAALRSFGADRVEVVAFDRTLAGALERFFLALSPRSRELRFLSPAMGTTPQQLRPLLDVDGMRHVAHLALVDGAVVGEARFVRLGAGRATAELAIAVADDWQGRGVGRRLLDSLVSAAARRGVRRLTFDALAENRRALGFFARRGARWVVRDGVAEGELPATPSVGAQPREAP
jgi:GNAT superfamily N-acetyltransferase